MTPRGWRRSGLSAVPTVQAGLSAVPPACHPDRAQAMGRAGRRRVEQHFTLERMVGETAGVYEMLLASRGRGGK